MKRIINTYHGLPKHHKTIIHVLTAILLLLLLSPTNTSDDESSPSDGAPLEVGKRYSVALPADDDNTHKDGETPIDDTRHYAEPSIHWQTATVKNGDYLEKILKRFGFNSRVTYQISNAKGEYSKLLRKLNVGDTLKLSSDDNNKLLSLEYPRSQTETIRIEWRDGAYHSSKETKTIDSQEAIAHGTITSNFWNAAVDAGLNDGQIIGLANIFGWDIDFALDIRKGDSFHVIFEKQYIEGEFIGNGKILAAEFINRNDSFQAIRFTDGEFYSPDGKSMRKAFLRAPISFRYVSSNFNPRRLHPVTKQWKAHRGTDYVAKVGTPVLAAGNGRVTHSSYNKYNGHYVFIQHGHGIVTKYLHFTKRAVKKGQRVKQGQVIGYLGGTGRVSGPHLHYEFLLNGVHRNPRTVKLPDAKPIKRSFKAEFKAIAQERLKQLNGSKQAMSSMYFSDAQTAE